MEVLFQDENILVIHKPAGIASQQTKANGKNIVDEVDAPFYPVNRLDQRVSGIMLLAKQEQGLAQINEAFQNRDIIKKYRAVVANKPPEIAGHLTHWLLKDAKLNKAKVFNKEIAHSKKAELSYRLIQSSNKYHLLDIELTTGRFHQIRAQLAAIGSPIVGDIKYGYKRSSPDGSIFLQSYLLEFNHPVTQQKLHFEIGIPELWHKYGIVL